MKLIREIVMTEGQGPFPVKLTLGEIISSGGVTNPYQIYVLAWLSEFFKDGLKSASLQLENPIQMGSATTSSAVIDSLKTMAPANQVQLAQYLSDCIDAGECALHNKESNVVEWIKFVLHAQK